MESGGETAQGNDDGCTGQPRADHGLPKCSGDGEVATDYSVKGFIDGSGSLVDPGGGNELLQQGAREGGEVRLGWVEGGGAAELIGKVESGGDRFRKCGEGSSRAVTDAG
jgi:hypothetical protein